LALSFGKAEEKVLPEEVQRKFWRGRPSSPMTSRGFEGTLAGRGASRYSFWSQFCISLEGSGRILAPCPQMHVKITNMSLGLPDAAVRMHIIESHYLMLAVRGSQLHVRELYMLIKRGSRETERAMQPCKKTLQQQQMDLQHQKMDLEGQIRPKQVSENLQISYVLPLQGTFKGW